MVFLSADACFELGRIAYEDGDYYHGFHWMAIAKERLDKETNKTTDMTEILDYMAWTAHEVKHMTKSKGDSCFSMFKSGKSIKKTQITATNTN